MVASDGSSQKRVSRRKTGDPNALQLSEAPDRETRATDDDIFDDETAADPPRSSSTAIRRATLGPASRMTAPPNSPIPHRRSGGQPLQPTASVPTPPAVTKSYIPRNPPPQQTPSPTANKIRSKAHWLLPAGIGMIAMLLLWEIGTLVLSWGLARYDDIRYGNPRTFQTDFVVGHGGDSPQHPSHFIAINLNRQAIVVEFPAGNPAGAESYVVPYYILGQGGDLTPITLEFRDVTGDGLPDMIIHIHLQNQDQTFVFVNDGKKFRPPTSKDNIHM